MKNKEKYDLTKLDVLVQDKLLKFFNKDNAEKLFESEWRSYIELAFNILNWLEQEHQEPITLTEDEKTILKNIDKDYKWIVRDAKDLKVFIDKPYKDGVKWEDDYTTWYKNLHHFNHLFQFIKWEDEEPYNIDELLKMNGVER